MKNFINSPFAVMIMIITLVLGVEFIASVYLEDILMMQFKLSGITLEIVDIAVEVIAMTPLLYLGVFRRLIRNEQATQISQTQFSTIFNQAPLGIALIDSLNGKIYEINPRFAEIAGRTDEEMRSTDWMSITHPDDVQKDLDNMALLNAGKIPGFKMDKRYIRPDGSIVWIRMTIAPLRGNENISPRHLCMIDDITGEMNAREQLKHSEQGLADAQRMAHLGSWELDIKTNTLVWSEEIYRIFEINPEKFGASYDAFLDAIHPEDREFVNNAYTESLKNHTPYDIEHRILMKDGRVKFVNEHSETFYSQDGQPIRSIGTVYDITEHKHAAEAVSAANELLRSVVENAPIRVFWKDAELRYLGCNTAFAKDAGMSKPEELIGKDDYQMGWSAEAELYRADDRRVMDSGAAKLDYEEQQTTPNGSIIWIRTSKVPLVNAAGKTVGLLGIYEDITERKVAQTKIKRLANLYATLSQSNKAIVYSNNKEELFTQVCRAAVEESGFKMAWVGLVDTTSKLIVPAASFGDKAGYLENIEISIDENDPRGRGPSGTAVREGKPYWCQDFQNDPRTAPWREAGARSGWVGSAAIPIYQKGVTVGAITLYAGEINAFDEQARNLLTEMAGDISYALDTLVDKAEKDALEAEIEEEKAQDEAIMANLGEGLIAVDNSGRFINMNRKAEEMTGWKEAEVIGKTLIETIRIKDESGDDLPSEQRPISIVLKTKVPSSSDSLYLVQKSGTIIPVAIIATPVILDNKLIGAVTVIRDITKEKEIEKTRGDLLALASHQLRTPLSGTKWLIETLQSGIKGPMSSDQKEYLNEIYNINQRMTSLVSDMLGVLRMEGGTIPAKKEPVQTSTVLNALLETFSPVATNKQLVIHINKDGDHMIETDPLLLRNILESFVSNAITYSKNGGEIILSLKEEEHGVVFAVKDSGIGIPKDEQGSHLFERFYRASNAKMFNTKGTGLGLYIAATLAKKIGATISFESEEGKGTTFSVHVPYSEPS